MKLLTKIWRPVELIPQDQKKTIKIGPEDVPNSMLWF